MSDDPGVIRRLSKLDACAVSDALDSLQLPGTVTGIQRLATQQRICGKVLTVTLERAAAATGVPGASSPRHLCTGAIEAAQPGDVIVVQQRTGLDAAGWGGVLSIAAQAKQIAGVIVEGPARDIDESQQAGFPVFARNATARTARGRVREVAFNEPITVGDVQVEPGDLVIADGSGVVFIAHEHVETVLAAAERIAAKEALMIQSARANRPASEVMGADYESMLEHHGSKAT
jgi:4-hydroxy-4-methyl-2-oxoglutarate aldolase